MILIKKRLLGYPLIILLAFIYTLLAIYSINNPDYPNYQDLVKSFSTESITLNIEPILGVLSYISIIISDSTGVDSTIVIYFMYILLMQIFLYLALLNIFNNLIKSSLILILWFFLYGTIHFLIQIRFGLANCVFLYLFSLTFIRSSFTKFGMISVLTFLTHYSSILSIFSAFVERFKNIFFARKSFYIFNIVFAFVLIAVTKLNLLYLLPDFMLGRISNYFQSDLEGVSVFTTIMSIFLYLLLFFTKPGTNKIDSLRMYGVASFLPYIITPEVEILVRLGTGLQYLLLPYFFLTYKIKRLLLTSTIPLLFFYIYKLYSNITAFMSYL